MSRFSKLKERISEPEAQNNITFDELCYVVQKLGFIHRKKPSGHNVFTKDGIPEIINLQPGQNGKAKRYQVQQVADLVLQYDL